ncbi:regucalcin [Patella vulgata]|uniref:regucalcin n=1 Tax=Patella vulgata TaxID=6465 RepID=UPI0021803DB2|nr:regucalcin [Patella vulgata]XP_050402143.1 regucalcin [Patella vulgata]XP_050402144.1 regucalcin [Patella vulgata]XP_050402145.1 regucalcin [Patella vulgata]XP_050402146.1 regucalcin [Patella vulgata]XP_050402147.1 regucalcin [Patella vulgata]XP_050402148.1 regucalcin [Patella vulgata]XP_050402150.1 regucalcin [Patella vulgata]
MAAKVEVVVKNVAETVGEGPHWDDKTQSLLYVDIMSNDVYKWKPETKENSKIHLDDFVSLVVPTEKNDYIISLGKSLARLDWNTQKVTVLKEFDSTIATRFNDGKCDASGRLYAGTMSLESAPCVLEHECGSLYSYGVDGTIQTHETKVTISNGLAWTQDNKTMYYIDSTPRKVYVYDFDLASGKMSNRRTLINFPDYEPGEIMGLPDGMTIDTQDKIWVACYSAGRVVRFDPETAKILQVVKIDAVKTTSCCFGGKNLDELYVTSAKAGYTEEEFRTKDPLAGSIFKVSGLGVKGYPAYPFRG